MIDIEVLKGQIRARWHGLPAADLCVSILDFLRDTPADQLHMLTFATLAKVAGRPSVDTDVIAAVNILAASSYAVLNARAMLIDDEDNEFEIDMVELEEAQATGRLVHPETGLLLSNYERYVVPYFEPNDRLAS